MNLVCICSKSHFFRFTECQRAIQIAFAHLACASSKVAVSVPRHESRQRNHGDRYSAASLLNPQKKHSRRTPSRDGWDSLTLCRTKKSNVSNTNQTKAILARESRESPRIGKTQFRCIFYSIRSDSRASFFVLSKDNKIVLKSKSCIGSNGRIPVTSLPACRRCGYRWES
jgi:hypothetical protein